ncbi:MAG: hypothetical protein GY852_04140 [bacterium]|nr:hypothetical protein [bacterium]
MAPGKERVIARISAKGSAPAVSVLPKRPTKENNKPGFGAKDPISEAILRISDGPLPEVLEIPAKWRPIDTVSLNLMENGFDAKAHELFGLLRKIAREEAEASSFNADSSGVFLGGRKIGQVSGSTSDSPLIKIWMDWLYKHPGSRASNYEILGKLPLPVLVTAFKVGEIVPFVQTVASTRYMLIEAAKSTVTLQLFKTKTGPVLHSFEAK